jgi:hypothetical protein
VICQFCEIEYAAETKRCAQCGCELVESLPEGSAEVVLEPLGETFRRRQLDRLVESLEAADIPYIVHSGTALGMQDGQMLRNAARREDWEARILVVSTRHEEAREAWKESAEGLEDEEWEEPAEGVELD